jgi:uncharacterized membrane protein
VGTNTVLPSLRHGQEPDLMVAALQTSRASLVFGVEGVMTPTSHRSARSRSAGAPLVAQLHRIENAEVLDRPAEVLARVVDSALSSPQASSVLRGEQLGHALHPLLTDFPLGAWMSTSLLDVFGGRRARGAATALLGFGLAAAVPTVLSGLVEWQATAGAARRVGVVHAVVNGAALALCTSSLRARLSGRHARGVMLSVAGGAVATVGGYLGGHLSLVLKVGTGDRSLVSSDGLAASPGV